MLSRHSERAGCPITRRTNPRPRAISEEAAALLRPADEVVAINNTPMASDLTLPQLRRYRARRRLHAEKSAAPGDGRPVATGATVPTSSWIVRIALQIIIPNIFLLTGLVVFLLKPNDKAGALAGLDVRQVSRLDTGEHASVRGPPAMAHPGDVSSQRTSLLLPPVFPALFQIFPEPSALIRKYPKLEKLLYVPHLVLFVPYFAIINLLAAFAARGTTNSAKAIRASKGSDLR